MAARYTVLFAGLAGVHSSVMTHTGVRMRAERDVRTEAAAEWHVVPESRMHVPPDARGVPSVSKFQVAEGGSVLLECNSPGWTYCRWGL